MFGQQLEQLVSLLDLEQLEQDWFRGESPRSGRDRIFGGQVMAQALVAAGRTVEGRVAHSFHGYFLRPGDPERPILYEVSRIRDGRSFATRSVIAVQAGEAIFALSASFQREEPGLAHQRERPAPGEPDGPSYEDEIRAEIEKHGGAVERDDRRFELPIEVRSEGGLHLFDPGTRPPRLRTWLRPKGPLPDDPALHQAVLAYASDLTLLVSAIYPHPVAMNRDGFRSASLDHTMWFHRPFRFDDWLLFEQESPVSAGSRGFARGGFHTRDGALVASCCQEGLIRQRRPGARGGG